MEIRSTVLSVVTLVLVSGAVVGSSGAGERPACGEKDLKMQTVLRAHAEEVTSVAIAMTGNQVISGGADKSVRLWNVATARPVRVFSALDSVVKAVMFSLDGREIIAATAVRFYRWDQRSGSELTAPDEKISFARAVTASRDGMWIVARSGPPWVREGLGNMSLWQTNPLRRVRFFQGDTSIGNAVAISPDGKVVVTGHDNELRVWDGRDGRLTRVTGVRGSASQDTSEERIAELLTAAPWTYSLTISGTAAVAVSGHRGVICVWELATGRRLRCFEAHRGAVGSVVLSWDDQRLVSGGEDGVVRVWDTATWRAVQQFEGDAAAIRALAVSVDGRFVVSGRTDGTVGISAPCE